MSTSYQEQANTQIAKRQIEINEWTYNNRMETLFVFQILFISLMLVAILMYLKGAGFVGRIFTGYVLLILVAIVILIIINRSMYTNRIRDRHSWNKRRFDDDNKMIPSTFNNGDYQSYLARMKATDTSSNPCSKCPK